MRSYILLALTFFFAFVSAQAQLDVDNMDEVEVAGGVRYLVDIIRLSWYLAVP